MMNSRYGRIALLLVLFAGVGSLMRTLHPFADANVSLERLQQLVLSATKRQCRSFVLRPSTTQDNFSLVLPYKPSGDNNYCGCVVCKDFYYNGVYAPASTFIMEHVLTGNCGSGAGIVLDLQPDVGYFPLIAARHGCRVEAIKGEPSHALLLLASAAHSNVDDNIEFITLDQLPTPEEEPEEPEPPIDQPDHKAAPIPARRALLAAPRTAAVIRQPQPAASFADSSSILLLKLTYDSDHIPAFLDLRLQHFLEHRAVQNVLLHIRNHSQPDAAALVHVLAEQLKLPCVLNYKDIYSSGTPDHIKQVLTLGPEHVDDITESVTGHGAPQDRHTPKRNPFQYADFWLARTDCTELKQTLQAIRSSAGA